MGFSFTQMNFREVSILQECKWWIASLSGRLCCTKTSCVWSQSVRHFGRNKGFRREGDGHKRSPPALHLTLSLTLENNKKANSKRVPRRAAERTACAQGLRQREPRVSPTCAAPIWPRPQLTVGWSQVFSSSTLFLSLNGLWSSQQLRAQASRCLPQLCLSKLRRGNSEAAGTGVFLGARSSQRRGLAKRFDTLWEISALYPCKLSTAQLPQVVGVDLQKAFQSHSLCLLEESSPAKPWDKFYRVTIFLFQKQTCKNRIRQNVSTNMKKIKCVSLNV